MLPRIPGGCPRCGGHPVRDPRSLRLTVLSCSGGPAVPTCWHADVVWAKVVLLALTVWRDTVIAAPLDVHVGVVGRWGSGSPRRGWLAWPTASGTACGGCLLPRWSPRSRRWRAAARGRDAPQSRWSSADLAAQAAAEGLVAPVSRSTVRRWLDEDAIRPWTYRSWIFPRDPDFVARAGRVLDLYQRSGTVLSWPTTST